MNIILTGSLAFDRIMDFPGNFSDHILPERIHVLNVAFNINRLEEKRGGTAGNIAYNLHLLGQRPSIISSVGKDFGPYREFFMQQGIALDYIEEHSDVTTASAYIITDKNDNQITGFYMGAMQRSTHADLSTMGTDNALVISPGNIQDMLRYHREAQMLGWKTIVDPGQAIPSLSEEELQELVSGFSVLIMNDYELQMILHRTQWQLEDLRKRGDMLIVTYADKGSTIFTQHSEDHIPICPVTTTVDPTGAGDAYRSGIIVGIIHELPLDAMGRIAATAASYAVEHYGTQEHSYILQEFRERYQMCFHTPCPLFLKK